MMTHPFALTIDDLTWMELVDESQLEGGRFAPPHLPPEVLTLAQSAEGGNYPTFKLENGCPPWVSTNRYPENGGPTFTTARYPENGGPILN
jgi:hypothetical protein